AGCLCNTLFAEDVSPDGPDATHSTDYRRKRKALACCMHDESMIYWYNASACSHPISKAPSSDNRGNGCSICPLGSTSPSRGLTPSSFQSFLWDRPARPLHSAGS